MRKHFTEYLQNGIFLWLIFFKCTSICKWLCKDTKNLAKLDLFFAAGLSKYYIFSQLKFWNVRFFCYSSHKYTFIFPGSTKLQSFHHYNSWSKTISLIWFFNSVINELLFCKKSFFSQLITKLRISQELFPAGAAFSLPIWEICVNFTTVKKSIFEIKFWDWSVLNLLKKLSHIFGSNFAKFLENYQEASQICFISHIKPQQYYCNH